MTASSLNTYSNMSSLKYYMRMSFADYKRPTPFETEAPVFDKHVFLPLPQELRDDTTVNYDTQNLDMIGDIINGKILEGAASQVLRRTGSLAQGVLEGTAQVADGGIIGALMSEVRQALPAEAITSAIQQSIGLAPNPNPSVALQGPELRSLVFTFILAPTNRDESNKIRNIINYLKQAALPENSISGAASILKYPKMVQVNFYPWDNNGPKPYGWTEKSIIKMKRCFIQSINVNYTPSNTPAFFHDTNEPVMIQLSISLKEIEYFLARDYGGGEGTFAGVGDVVRNLASVAGTITGVPDQILVNSGNLVDSFGDLGNLLNPVASGQS